MAQGAGSCTITRPMIQCAWILQLTQHQSGISKASFKGYVDLAPRYLSGRLPLSGMSLRTESDFSLPAPVAESAPSAFTVIVNWTAY